MGLQKVVRQCNIVIKYNIYFILFLYKYIYIYIYFIKQYKK